MISRLRQVLARPWRSQRRAAGLWCRLACQKAALAARRLSRKRGLGRPASGGSPVASGRLAYRLEAGVDGSCLQAAQDVLNGNITVGCLYFRQNNGIIQGTVIGNHVFY